MKGHESKMARMEDILNLPVQDPPCAEFSAAHITWNVLLASALSQGGRDLKEVLANQGLMDILSILYTGVLMVLKTTVIVNLVLGMVQTSNPPQGREAGQGDAT